MRRRAGACCYIAAPMRPLRAEESRLRSFDGTELAWHSLGAGAPVLDSLAMEHHTITRHDELEFIADRSIKQAVATQAGVALILSPLLTGGKVFKA